MARHSANTKVMLPGTDVGLDLAHLNAHIAAELAAGLSDAATIRERYGISQAQWDMLRVNPAFRHMLGDAVQKLQGDFNAGKRITMKSEIALEDSIPVLYEIANDRDAQSAARVDAVKTMAALAGRNTKEGAPGASGGGFSISINFAGENGKAGKVVIDGVAVPPVPEPTT